MKSVLKGLVGGLAGVALMCALAPLPVQAQDQNDQPPVLKRAPGSGSPDQAQPAPATESKTSTTTPAQPTAQPAPATGSKTSQPAQPAAQSQPVTTAASEAPSTHQQDTRGDRPPILLKRDANTPASPTTGYIPPPPGEAQNLLPAGSTLHIKLTTTLTSKTNKTGDPFTGEVAQAVSVNGTEVIPKGSSVDGHVAFVKSSGRVAGKAAMRVVLDSITTPDDVKYDLNATLDDAAGGGACGQTPSGEEGTIKGCGKSKKAAAKDAAIAGGVGAGAGATVGMGKEIECQYYGMCGGAGIGTDILAGAGLGVGTALIYNLLKHEKQIVLIHGTPLTFTVARSSKGVKVPDAALATTPQSQPQQ